MVFVVSHGLVPLVPRRSTLGAAIHKTIQIKATPAEVFEALTDSAKLRQWYYDDAAVDPRPGQALTFGGIEGTMRATVQEVVPGRSFSYEFHAPWWGIVSFALEESPTGTKVTLDHRGFDGREDWLDRFAWGWDTHMKNLKSFAEGRPIK
ncbi:MAG: SRPBCC family protein [Thermoplasmatota archaeon]